MLFPDSSEFARAKHSKSIFDSFLPIALICGFFKNVQQTSALNQGNNEAICNITPGNHASLSTINPDCFDYQISMIAINN